VLPEKRNVLQRTILININVLIKQKESVSVLFALQCVKVKDNNITKSWERKQTAVAYRIGWENFEIDVGVSASER